MITHQPNEYYIKTINSEVPIRFHGVFSCLHAELAKLAHIAERCRKRYKNPQVAQLVIDSIVLNAEIFLAAEKLRHRAAIKRKQEREK